MTDKICNNFIDNHYLSKFQSKVKSVTKKEKPLKIQKIRYKFNLLTPKKTVCENEKTLKCEICQSWFGKNYYKAIQMWKCQSYFVSVISVLLSWSNYRP